MPTNIRIALPADVDELVRLNRIVQAIHVDLAPDRFRDDLDDGELQSFWAQRMAESNSTVSLAEFGDGRAVGSVWFELQERPRTALIRAHRRLYVHHLVVDPAFRRMGIGADLMRFVEADASTRDVNLIGVDSWTANSAAQEFFEALGYAPLSNVRGKKLKPG